MYKILRDRRFCAVPISTIFFFFSVNIQCGLLPVVFILPLNGMKFKKLRPFIYFQFNQKPKLPTDSAVSNANFRLEITHFIKRQLWYLTFSTKYCQFHFNGHIQSYMRRNVVVVWILAKLFEFVELQSNWIETEQTQQNGFMFYVYRISWWFCKLKFKHTQCV